ncbi:MAG: hypothetical protein ACK4NB_01675 [Fimbriimonadales bacterium]
MELLWLLCFLGVIGLLLYQAVQQMRANARERRVSGMSGGEDGSFVYPFSSDVPSPTKADAETSSGYDGGFSEGGFGDGGAGDGGGGGGD